MTRRFAPLCDACGKPCVDYATDEEVCGGTDGPGFYLCARKRCQAKVPVSIADRDRYYAVQRALNDTTPFRCVFDGIVHVHRRFGYIETVCGINYERAAYMRTIQPVTCIACAAHQDPT